MTTEKRTGDNTAVYQMVDCLREYVDARDAIWSLSIVDKLLRPAKCRAIMKEYSDTLFLLRASIRELVEPDPQEETRPEDTEPNNRWQHQEPTPLLSPEEFAMLLERPENKAPTRARA